MKEEVEEKEKALLELKNIHTYNMRSLPNLAEDRIWYMAMKLTFWSHIGLMLKKQIWEAENRVRHLK